MLSFLTHKSHSVWGKFCFPNELHQYISFHVFLQSDAEAPPSIAESIFSPLNAGQVWGMASMSRTQQTSNTKLDKAYKLPLGSLLGSCSGNPATLFWGNQARTQKGQVQSTWSARGNPASPTRAWESKRSDDSRPQPWSCCLPAPNGAEMSWLHQALATGQIPKWERCLCVKTPGLWGRVCYVPIGNQNSNTPLLENL